MHYLVGQKSTPVSVLERRHKILPVGDPLFVADHVTLLWWHRVNRVTAFVQRDHAEVL
jgi:hypothetical protein